MSLSVPVLEELLGLVRAVRDGSIEEIERVDRDAAQIERVVRAVRERVQIRRLQELRFPVEGDH